jgi:hypothetical protein
MPAFNAVLNDLSLGLTCEGKSCDQLGSLSGQELRLSGLMNFSPAGDPLLPGTLSFNGKGETYKNGANTGSRYVVSLSGSTVNTGEHRQLKYTLSGTMTRDTKSVPDGSMADQLGFSPSLSLVGTVNYTGKLVAGIKDTRGVVQPSSEKQPSGGGAGGAGGGGGKSLVYSISKSGDPEAGADQAFNTRKMRDSNPDLASAMAKGAGGGGGSPAKSSGGASASGTQFGSLVQFILAYGLNGGPNWTFKTFKGPSASGNLFGLSRQQTDTLQITFVAACNDDSNPQTIDTYWDSIPKCNGTQQAIAGAAGQSLLYQAQPLATLR